MDDMKEFEVENIWVRGHREQWKNRWEAAGREDTVSPRDSQRDRLGFLERGLLGS